MAEDDDSLWRLALTHVAGREQEVTKLVYEVSEDDVTRAKNQFKAMQLFGIDSTAGASLNHPLAEGWRML